MDLLMRLLDFSLSWIVLCLFVPLFLVITIVIKLTSPGPVFYQALRVGHGGRLFHLYKFRTMMVDAKHLGPPLTGEDDQRITSIGRFLRQTKIDELPQLLNVIKGDMNLVGPRAEDPKYVASYSPKPLETWIVDKEQSVHPRTHSPAGSAAFELALPQTTPE